MAAGSVVLTWIYRGSGSGVLVVAVRIVVVEMQAQRLARERRGSPASDRQQGGM